MKNQPSDESESLWRHKLSEVERAELRTRPELELEARLSDALGRVPDAPVPSNFTARVLNAIELEENRAARKGWNWKWRLLLPRLAVATAIVIVAGIGIGVQHHETRLHRVALAQNVAKVAVAQPPPSMDVLENLDAIQRMGESGHADGELLAALQ